MHKPPRTAQREKRFREIWAETAESLAESLGRPLAAHVPSVLALSGIGLYLLGVIRIVGILRAEDIPVTRGLPLLELQDYLLRGLTLTVRPQLLVMLAVFLVLITYVLAIGNWWRERGREARAFEMGVDWIVLLTLFVLVPVFLFPLAEWLSMVPGLALAIVCVAKLERHNRVTVAATSPRAAFLVVGFFLSLGIAIAGRAYYYPPPLDTVTITRAPATHSSSRLLYESGGVLYLVGPRSESGGNRGIEAVPSSSLQSFEIRDGEARNFQTLPELLGLHLYRIWEDDNSGLHLESTPK